LSVETEGPTTPAASLRLCLYGKRWLIVYDYGVAAWVAVHKSGTEERAIAPYTEAELITKLDAVEAEQS